MIVPLALLTLTLQAQKPIDNPCVNGYTENVWDPRFTPGQRWTYRNRPVDKDSTFLINKIDQVPDVGVVIQITVERADVSKDRSDAPTKGYSGSVPIAIRRDSLDASSLEPIGIAQAQVPPPNYGAWKKNCQGLTYGSTLADAVQTEHEAYLARRSTAIVPFAAVRIGARRHENFEISLFLVPKTFALVGSLISRNGVPIKDADIQVEISEVDVARVPSNVGSFQPIKVKTNIDGSFELPPLPQVGSYTLKLTMNGFQPVTGELRQVSSLISFRVRHAN
jgi:hypothetical protein